MSELSKLAYRLIVAVATGALAKGIIAWSGLDSKVANLLHIAATPHNESVIAWVASGAVGLIGLVLWIVVRVEGRLYDIIQPRPMLGSLAVVPNGFVARLNHHRQANRNDAELSVELKNKNEFLVQFHACLTPDFPDEVGFACTFWSNLP